MERAARRWIDRRLDKLLRSSVRIRKNCRGTLNGPGAALPPIGPQSVVPLINSDVGISTGGDFAAGTGPVHWGGPGTGVPLEPATDLMVAGSSAVSHTYTCTPRTGSAQTRPTRFVAGGFGAIFKGSLYSNVSIDVADANVLMEVGPEGAFGSAALFRIVTGLGSGVVFVPPGTNTLVNAILKYKGTGVTLQLGPGTYNEDFSSATGPLGTLNGNLNIVGSSPAIVQTDSAAAFATMTAGMTVIKVTAAPTVSGQVTLQDIGWYDVVFTTVATLTTANNVIWGTGNTRNVFYRCAWVDMWCPMFRAHGPDLRIYNSRITTSTAAVSTTSFCLSPQGPFYFVDSVWDVSTPVICVGSGAATGDEATVGNFFDWYFINSRFLDSGQFGCDAIIDGEYTGATSFRTLYVYNCELWNGKIYTAGIDTTQVYYNTFYTTVSQPGGSGAAVRSGPSAGGTVLGVVDIVGNKFYSADIATTTDSSAIQMVNGHFQKYLRIKDNTMVINGASTTAGATKNVPINVQSSAVAAPVFDYIEIRGNTIGYTSVPGTPRPAILVAPGVAATWGKLVVSENTVIGASTATMDKIPATVGGGVCVNLLRLGQGAIVSTFVNVDLFDNDVSAVSPTGTAPFLYDTVGTIAITTLQGRGNSPSMADQALTIPSTGAAYVHGKSFVNGTTVLANGDAYLLKTVTNSATATTINGQSQTEANYLLVPIRIAMGDSVVWTYAGAAPAVRLAGTKS